MTHWDVASLTHWILFICLNGPYSEVFFYALLICPFCSSTFKHLRIFLLFLLYLQNPLVGIWRLLLYSRSFSVSLVAETGSSKSLVLQSCLLTWSNVWGWMKVWITHVILQGPGSPLTACSISYQRQVLCKACQHPDWLHPPSVWWCVFVFPVWSGGANVQSLSHVQLLATHELQHTRLPCPSLFPRVCSSSCPLSLWSHPLISSSVTPFSSCSQIFPSISLF